MLARILLSIPCPLAPPRFLLPLLLSLLPILAFPLGVRLGLAVCGRLKTNDCTKALLPCCKRSNMRVRLREVPRAIVDGISRYIGCMISA